MPKIPMANKPGMIQHQRDTVPMTGAPGMNFNMDESRALMNLGERIGNAGAKIGDAINRTVSVREQFLVKQQYTQDRLAATEARNLYRNINMDLENRMAENPAEFEKFKDWAAEADKRYAETVLDFTQKMSPEFRQQFESEMKGLRSENLMRRTRIGIQAKVTADYNLFQSQWKDAALRGDLTACNRMLEEQNGSLISQQEYEQKKLDFNRMAVFGEVKRLVEAGTPDIVSRLKKRTEEGKYANFRSLDDASRDRFIRFAEAEETRREAETDQKVLAALADGNILYPDDILKKKHQEGTLSDRQYHTYKGWYDSYRAKEKRAADYQANAKEKAAKATRQQQLDRLFSLIGYDENGFSKTLDDSAFSDAFGKIKKICGNDYSLYSDSMQKLNSIRTKDLSFRKTSLYKDGDGILSQWKKAGRMAAEGWWGRDAADTSDEAKFFVERAMRMDLENFCLEHPKASTKELYDYLNGRLQTYNALKLEKIITSGGKSMQKAVENANPYKDITVTVPPGWRFKGGDPSKEENWERTATK